MMEQIDRKLNSGEKKFIEKEMLKAKIIALYKLGFAPEVIVKKTAVNIDAIRFVLSQM